MRCKKYRFEGIGHGWVKGLIRVAVAFKKRVKLLFYNSGTLQKSWVGGG